MRLRAPALTAPQRARGSRTMAPTPATWTKSNTPPSWRANWAKGKKPGPGQEGAVTEAASMLQLLTPRRVAVLGASDNPVKAGGRPIAYMRRYGFQGDIYPVNPRRTEVQGLPCYASLADLPQAPDLVVISLAGSQVDAALAQCIAAGARCAVIYASGFAELGAAGLAAQQALMRRASAAGLRLIGPNTQGVANFQTGAVLNFSTMINECAPQDGAIAIVSQSGAGAGILYGGLRRQGLGVRYMVATGNEAGVKVARAVRGLLEDPSLPLILMYAEAWRDPGLLAEAATLSARRDVPILAVKAARTPAGQATASSHTGALASEDALAEAFLRQHNIVRVRDFDELVEYAQLFERRERPRGRKLVALSNSGATCVLAADAIEQNDMLSAEFTPSHAQALRAVLPAYVAVRNPIDMTTALLGQPGIYGDALRTVADSGAAHGVFVGFPVGGEGYDMSYFARQTMDFVAATGLQVAVGAVQDGVARAFRTCGLPVFGSEFRASRGLALLASDEEGRAALRAGAESAGCAGAAAGLPVTGAAGGAAWDEPASLVSRHRSDVVGCAQPSERSARRIAQPIPSVLASDATPRCASMASADRQMIGDATLEAPALDSDVPVPDGAILPLDSLAGEWMSREDIVHLPSLRNQWGQAHVNADLSSLSWLAMPPFSGGDPTGSLRVNGAPLAATAFRWSAWGVQRKHDTPDLSVETEVRFGFRERNVNWRIRVHNNSAQPQSVVLEQELLAMMAQSTVHWGWTYGTPWNHAHHHNF